MSNQIPHSRQADTIEITPAMIAAAQGILASIGPIWVYELDGQLIEAIYRAMTDAAPFRPQSVSD
jgi:hypothetical protein